MLDLDDWLRAERDRAQAAWRSTLQTPALAAEAAGATRAALGYLRRLLDDDPLTERHQVALIRLHAAAGRREEALAASLPGAVGRA